MTIFQARRPVVFDEIELDLGTERERSVAETRTLHELSERLDAISQSHVECSEVAIVECLAMNLESHAETIASHRHLARERDTNRLDTRKLASS